MMTFGSCLAKKLARGISWQEPVVWGGRGDCAAAEQSKGTFGSRDLVKDLKFS